MSYQRNRPAKIRKIISVNDNKDMDSLRGVLQSSGGTIIKELPLVNGFLCEFDQETSVGVSVRALEEKVTVEDDIKFKLCELPRFFFPPGFLFPHPYWFGPQKTTPPKTPATIFSNVDWGMRRIGATEVWGKLKDRRVRVGIIDTGINYMHPDLRENIREGISTLDGHNSFLDDYGHGTHVAGVIGANNRYGKIGINPNADFYAVKAFNNKGSGSLADIIEGIDWLMRRQVEIINMSFSTSETSASFVRAIRAAVSRGIIMVAAAGNDGKDVNYPARFPEVIAVSATDKNDRIAEFSCFGPEINFCAPGVNINSTWLGDGYSVKSGTSFAAPHIVGAVADVLNYYGPMSAQQAIRVLSQGAVTLAHLSREQQGAGMVELPRIIN